MGSIRSLLEPSVPSIDLAQSIDIFRRPPEAGVTAPRQRPSWWPPGRGRPGGLHVKAAPAAPGRDAPTVLGPMGPHTVNTCPPPKLRTPKMGPLGLHILPLGL